MELSTSLTTFDTMSTPGSFYTAKDSPPPLGLLADTSAISSPIEPDDEPPFIPRYRDTTELPHELKSHCQIHIEEEQYAPAILLLEGLLSDGNTMLPRGGRYAATLQRPKPARIPPPSHIALLSTLTIHPTFTSRLVEHNNSIAAQSMKYLRGLLATAGPVHANLCEAFRFSNGRVDGSHNRRWGSSVSGNRSGSPDEESDSIGGKLAVEQSLWQRAPDFWSAMGWAFHCSVAHPHRWRHWKVWLRFMVDVLEKDWDERLAQDQENHALGNGKEACKFPMLQRSLFAAYLDDLRKERKNVLREVIRSLFAFVDNDQASDKVTYKEVFDRETATATSRSKRKRADTVVDLENNQFGDYLDADDFDFSAEEDDSKQRMPKATTVPRARRGRLPRREQRESALTSTSITPNPRGEFGVPEGVAESIPLRLRLFRLLSNASFYIPNPFTSTAELYETFADRVRESPLPIFRLFIESQSDALPREVCVSLLRQIVEQLLPTNRPDPDDVDPEINSIHGLSFVMMQKCFLPFAAVTITAEDNAKLSLGLENILWYMYSQEPGLPGTRLAKAIETGIKARENKIKDKMKRTRTAASGAHDPADMAREVLDRSARNLRVFMDIF
ncbi:hypothetical protein B0H63DRAFT_400979 [Podospora didyma]|uniref:Uncharacterized protein n=1 Tax=Podospora didyma TaxID=330526 RepID=A0AAE0N912_9PEZI|nr:hypothetical protein B0H63DRAFT_400979 [Podospora didyma]